MTTAWSLALREMRGGLRGLRLLILCLFLGVAGLAGVGSLGEAITAELDARGQEILGGDIELRVAQRAATRRRSCCVTRVPATTAQQRRPAPATRRRAQRAGSRWTTRHRTRC